MPTLRELRLRAGLSQLKLAELCEISYKTISRIENGHPCRESSRRILALVLDTPANQIDGIVCYDAHETAMKARLKGFEVGG